MGLTGIEVHDAVSGPVAIPASRISAMPFSSVAILPSMSNDARTPDKLVRASLRAPPSVSCVTCVYARCVV